MSRQQMSAVGRVLMVNSIGGVTVPLLVMWFDRDWTWPQIRVMLLYSMVYAHSIGTTCAMAFTSLCPSLGRMKKVWAWTSIPAR